MRLPRVLEDRQVERLGAERALLVDVRVMAVTFRGRRCIMEAVATKVFGDFEWDEDKARANQAKHGVSFEEATSVFLDIDYLLVPDRTHPDRFVALGYSRLARLLLVVHGERGQRIRIISARRSSRRERRAYERRRTEGAVRGIPGGDS